MVIREKALIRQMKESYKGSGYTVMVDDNDTWFIQGIGWTVRIDGRTNVPNEVLSLIVLHMGYLPAPETAYRVYKTKDGAAIQNEVFEVAMKPIRTLDVMRQDENNDQKLARRTKLYFENLRVWQIVRDLRIILVDPKFEEIMATKSEIRFVGEALCAEGEISCVYVFRTDADDDSSVQIEHLAKLQWTER